ncbi:MAG: hypothetical protein MK180_06780 [Rhodobacteraceae bacterium]|nr:hypothetical protein [Paracoccaceae bacterium]
MARPLTYLLAVSICVPSWASAEDQAPRPVFSEPYTVSDASAAYDAIDSRWDQTQIEQQERYSKHEGDYTTFVRSDPILQSVSWPYETCTDLISLIPPPVEDWGISSDASFVENPVKEDRAELIYVRFDPELQSDDEAFFQTEEYLTIMIARSPETVQAFEMMYEQEALRSVIFTAGPYNYPLMNQTNATIFGNISVGVTSNREEVATQYLTEIIGCAIKGGLVADIIDPASLDPVP